MRETEVDFKISDDFQTDWEYHKEDALTEMYEHAECLSQSIEHYIDNDELTIKLDNLDEVYKVIQEIKELAYYNYTGDRVNRWNEEYEDTFEYNFDREVKDYLSDHLGFDWRVDK